MYTYIDRLVLNDKSLLVPLNTGRSLLGSKLDCLKSMCGYGVDGLNGSTLINGGDGEVTRWGLKYSTILIGYKSQYDFLTIGSSEYIGSLDTILVSGLSDGDAIVNLNISPVACAFLCTFVIEELGALSALRSGSSGGQSQEDGKHSLIKKNKKYIK